MKRVFLIKQLGKKDFTLNNGRTVQVNHILVLRITVAKNSYFAMHLEVVEQPRKTPCKKCLREHILAQGELKDVIKFIPAKYFAEDKQFCAVKENFQISALCTPVLIHVKNQMMPYYLGIWESQV